MEDHAISSDIASILPLACINLKKKNKGTK